METKSTGLEAQRDTVRRRVWALQRGLLPETLNCRQFLNTYLTAGVAMLFPHHNEKGECGAEREGRNIEEVERRGSAGLWLSNVSPEDRRLVVTTSAVEALSYHQLNPYENRRNRYVSVGESLDTKQQLLLNRVVRRMPTGSSLIAAMGDNPALLEGRIAEKIRNIGLRHAHVCFRQHSPPRGKDWNDLLRNLDLER